MGRSRVTRACALAGVGTAIAMGGVASASAATPGPGSVPVSVHVAEAFPGLPAAVGVDGLQAGASYTIGTDDGQVSPNPVTAAANGTATATLTLAGASQASSADIWITETGNDAHLVDRAVPVSEPGIAIYPDYAWPMSFTTWGFAADEPLSVTYSAPGVVGPSNLLAPAVPSTLRTSLVGAPAASSTTFAVTVTGQTYGRTVTSTSTRPGYELATGSTLAVDPSAGDEHTLLASHLPSDALVDSSGTPEMFQDWTPTSLTVTGSRMQSTSGCAAAGLTMQSDGNLVLYCTRSGGQRVALWSSQTNHTGTANRVVMQSDGNLVLYTSAGKAVWSSKYGRAWPTQLPRGQSMFMGQQLVSPTYNSYAYAAVLDSAGALFVQGDGQWHTPNAGVGARLELQSDGNLVLYPSSGPAVWASNTVGSGANRLVMQSDGNLVLYTATGRVVWATYTNRAVAAGVAMPPGVRLSADGLISSGHYTAFLDSVGRFVVKGARTWSTPAAGPGAWLVLQTDGNVVLYSRGDRAIWASHTVGSGARELALQSDGNLVLVAIQGRVVWSSHTN